MIKALNFSYEKFNFPVGETMVRITVKPLGPIVDIEWEYESDVEFMELLLLNDALSRIGVGINRLTIPYFPHSRQDRVANEQETLSLKVACDLVNSLNSKEVIVYDPHSDVVMALLRNCRAVPQMVFFGTFLATKKDFYLISPDAGASKKIHQLLSVARPIAVVECSKKRNPLDGKVTGTFVPAFTLSRQPCVIVDDICDGGKTFVELAKELKRMGAGHTTLMVTHGFFTRGLTVFDGLIDTIITRKGVVK